MKKDKLTLQIFLQRLKNVDVVELLEKAKTINLEDVLQDIKKLKWKDLVKLKDSSAFYPTIGGSIAALLSIFVLKPSYLNLFETIEKSKKYESESQILPSLKKKLENNISIKNTFDNEMPGIKSIILSENHLIRLTNLLDEAAKKSGVNITKFKPAIYRDIESCSALRAKGRSSGSYNRSGQNPTNLANQNRQRIQRSISNTGISQGDLFEKQVLRDDLPVVLLKNLFLQIPKSPSKRFKSNYYEIQLNSSYINTVKFLSAIQQYKVTIIPFCFVPKSLGGSQFSSGLDQLTSSGDIQARLIINVPTL